MEAATLPGSFEDTTPAEMLRELNRRKQSSPHPPLVRDAPQPKSYKTIPSGSDRVQQSSNVSSVEEQHEEEEIHAPEPPRKWLGGRIWDAVTTWERDHIELVLENKQSVARDHLGILYISLTNLS